MGRTLKDGEAFLNDKQMVFDDFATFHNVPSKELSVNY